MGKMAAGMRMVQLVQVRLARVGERRMADIVPQGDGLNQIQVEMQRGAQGARDSGYQLYMQAAPGNVVVFDQRKHLRLVNIPVIVGTVQNFVHVMHEGRPPYRGLVGLHPAPPNDLPVVHPYARKRPLLLFPGHLPDQRVRQRFIAQHGFSLSFQAFRNLPGVLLLYNTRNALANPPAALPGAVPAGGRAWAREK